MQNFASTDSYLESMRQELSKSGLRMSIRPLVVILCLFLCLPKNGQKRGGVLKKKCHIICEKQQNHENFDFLKNGFPQVLVHKNDRHEVFGLF